MANKVRDFVVNSLKQFNEYLQENILPLYSNKQSDWNTSNTNDDSYIKNKPTIPPEVTESTVASWGFTKNTGSLTIETDPVFSASAAHSISANDITNWNNKISNVQGNWNTTNPSDESYIKNKPTIPSIEGLATETYVIDKISSQSYVTSSQLSSQGYLTSFTESDPVFRNSAASVITAQNILDWNAKVSNVQADWNEDDNTEESYINNKPYIENTYFVAATSSQAGNGSSTTTYLSTKWEANISSITDIYDGLVLILRMPSNLGVARAGAVLSINNGNYHPITYNVTTPIGTRFNTSYMLMLTYNANASAVTYLTAGTKTTTTGVWQMLADYDTNTNTDTKVRQWKDGSVMSVTTANNTDEHPILATYTLANNSNYKDQTAIYNPSYTLNTMTGEMIVGKISLLDGILSYNTYSLNIPETNGIIAVEEDILDIIKDNEFVTATVLNEHDNRLIDLENAGYLTEVPNTYPTYAAISSMGYLTSFTEIDPTVPTYIKNITEDNISSWNSRALSYYLYADGTKNLEVIKHLVFDLPRRNYSIVLDGLYYIQPAGQVSGSSFGNNTGWAPIIRVGIYENTSIIDLYFYTIFDKDSNNNIANNNWSISLYKTDRLTKANIESMTSIPYTLNSNSIFAFKSDLPPTITESTVAEWGFTKNTGTLTEETDPTVPSYIKNITETNISDWNDKVSKLELSGLGYITQASLDSNSYAGYAYVYDAYSYLITSITDNELVISTALNNHESRIDTLENAGYLTSFTETDPTVPAYVKNITETNISDWNNKVPLVTSTDNAIARFDGTTGNIQDSQVIIDDNGNIISSNAVYLTNISSSVISSTSKLYFGPVSSPYSYITANNGGVFGIYKASNGKGVSCYPDQNFFSNSNIDLGRTQSLWKNLYLSGTIGNATYSLSLPNKSGTIATTSDIPSITGLATETYVTAKVAALVDSAPGTLDTLNELATALGNDPNFATTTATALGNRVTKDELTGLGYVTQTTLSNQSYVTTTALSNQSYVTQTSLSSNSYAGYSYVYAAYSYVLNTIYDNEFVIATVLNYHNDRLEVLENAGYITSFSESDPIFAASPAHGITSTDITNWNNKVSNVRGDWNETNPSSYSYILNKPYIENIYFSEPESTAGNSTGPSSYLSTKWDVVIPQLDNIEDGTSILIRIPENNGALRAGAVISVNGGDYHPVTYNITTPIGTRIPISYTTLVTYNSSASAVTYLTAGTKTTVTGVWQIPYDYDTNSNTIGYQLRTNSMSLPMKSVTYRYRLLFTSADGNYFVPANNSTSTNATAARNVCQDKINPFGKIVYYGYTSSIAANSRPGATYLWSQYTLSLGYSFNKTGAALTLTSWKPVYVKCAPQADGSAIIDADTPYVQDLPSTEDGKIYIFLGIAYTETNIELVQEHPVYYYKDGAIRLWTGIEDRIAALESTVAGIESLLASI